MTTTPKPDAAQSQTPETDAAEKLFSAVCSSAVASPFARSLELRLRAAEKLINEDVYREGMFECSKCGFNLVKNNLYVHSGTMGPDMSPFNEYCPNDGTLMQRVKYRKLAQDNYEGALKIADERNMANEKLRASEQMVKELEYDREGLLNVLEHCALDPDKQPKDQYLVARMVVKEKRNPSPTTKPTGVRG